jgi:hypothetical protein
MSKKNKRSQSSNQMQAGLGLCIATPTLDGRLHAGCVASAMNIQKLCIENNVSFTWKVIAGNSILPLARNELAKQFLATKSTHMLMLDSDIQVDPRHVMYLLAHDRAVSALPCAKREVTWERLGDFVKEYPETSPEVYSALLAEGNFSTEEEVFDVDSDGFAKVLKVGTGAMMVKRTTLETIAAKLPDRMLNTSKGALYEYFAYTVDPETRIQYGEDYTFCNTWRSLGGTIDLLIAAKTTHHGQIPIAFDWKAIATTIADAKEKRGEV